MAGHVKGRGQPSEQRPSPREVSGADMLRVARQAAGHGQGAGFYPEEGLEKGPLVEIAGDTDGLNCAASSPDRSRQS